MSSSGCLHLVKLLEKCHEEYPVRKFFGRCNQIQKELAKCSKQEYEEKKRTAMAKKVRRKKPENWTENGDK